ncbi:autotransporter outer membrane beta-barrel domain-containing protein [Zobellella denitrificans]
MTLKKSPLAIAVAMAISMSTQANAAPFHGNIAIDGEAKVFVAGQEKATAQGDNPIEALFQGVAGGDSAVYQSEQSLLVIRDAELDFLDIELQDIDENKEEFLSVGSESTFVLDKVKSAETFIETNGAHIEHNGSASAIEIGHSTLTGVAFDEPKPDDEPFPEILQDHKELLVNNGGEIVSVGSGNAIDISNSTIDGLIINEDWGNEAENAMKGGVIGSSDGAAISVRDSEWKGGVLNGSRHDSAVIAGQRAAIELLDTVFEGAIINEALGNDSAVLPIIRGEERAILVAGGSFKGNIENEGLLEVGDDYGYGENTPGFGAIVLSETHFEGDIVNSGDIRQENDEYHGSDKAAILVERSKLTGSIINSGQIQGAIVVDGSKYGESYDEDNSSSWSDTVGHGSMKGDIINTGSIHANTYRGAIDIYGANLTGSIVNNGAIDSSSEGVRVSGGYVGEGSSTEDVINHIHSSEGMRGTLLGLIEGDIINREGASINSFGEGIELVSVSLTGNIENAGDINTQYGSGIVALGGFEASETQTVSSYKRTEKSFRSTINGHIINTGTIAVNSQDNQLASDSIFLGGVDLNGNIENHGTLTTSATGIGINGGETMEEEVTWQETETGSMSIHTGHWQSQASKLTGNVINTGNIVAGEDGVYIGDGAELHGNIINQGSIQAGKKGILLAGGYRDTGTFTYKDLWSPTGDWIGYEEDRSQLEMTTRPSAFNGNIINDGSIQSQGTGIELSSLIASASITNRGIINGPDTGIYVADDVSGSLTINQLAGELSGATALRMNQATRANYTGGQIIGDVANHGGTFYVEGERVIEGDYMQTAGSTLAMGLHQKTSLTANHINLAEGSRVLIDLTKGDLYVQNGEEVKLLKANSKDTLIAEGVSYAVSGSQLVTVAATRLDDDGNLVLTFDRSSFIEQAKDVVGKGQVSAQQANNVNALAAVLQKLDAMAKTNPAIASLLNNLDGGLESFTQLLPDVSGANVAGAMNASNLSNSQVSVRARGLASGDQLDNSGLWIQGLVSNGKQDNRHGDGYDLDSRGFVLGADTELNNGLVLGAAYSFTKSDTKAQNSRTDSDYHIATLYAGQALGQVLLDGQLYYAWGDNSSQRHGSFVSTRADYDSNLYGARVGAGYQFELGNAAQLIPGLSLEAARLSVDDYTESGAGALTIGKQHYDRLELGLAAELNKTYQLEHALLTPRVSLGAFHDFEAEAQSVTAAFAAAPSQTFTTAGRSPEKRRYVAGLGLDLMSGENLTISAEYNYNWNSDGFDANAGALKFRWDF